MMTKTIRNWPGRLLVPRLRPRIGVPLVAAALAAAGAIAADPMPNACPRDGCSVRIVDVRPAGKELAITFDANFTPDVSRNHIHVWWGDIYAVEQAGRNAETVHGVTQGRWHRHDDYPDYVTTEAASTSLRDGTTKLCTAAADRNHNIIDVSIFHCVDVAAQLEAAGS